MKNRIKYYAKESNLHALKYVANESKSWIISHSNKASFCFHSHVRSSSRLFWMIIFTGNFGIMLLVFYNSYIQFEENAVSFVTETTYLTWNTTFPAISVCPIAGAEPEWVINEEFNDEEIDQQKQFITDLVFFTGNCYSCYEDCDSCKKMNFSEKVMRYRKNCNQLMSSCKWNNINFNCCEEFHARETEYGICYSFNTLHITYNKKSKLDLTMNRKTGPGKIWFQLKQDARVYFHAPEDVPFINSDPDQRKDVMLGESFNITFSVIEINNDDYIKYIPIYKRKCKFPWENEGIIVHDYYSYSSCIVQCHAENHIILCNCTHHLMPTYNEGKYCDVEGLKCLTDNFEIVNRLHAKGSDFHKPGLICECLPSCIEPEYNIVSITKGLKSTQSEILINLIALPSTRFKRIAVRTTLDLIVSIGGAAGLFIGASLLSIIESLHLLCIGKPNIHLSSNRD